MGVVIQLADVSESARFRFSSGPCESEFDLAQVSRSALTIDAGGVGRFVEIGPAPREDGPRRVELSYCDTQQITGVCPYWVRVTQVDRSQAWSSPVYVDRLTSE